MATSKSLSFNTQPPEGGCTPSATATALTRVSTHSRPKAAGIHRPVFAHHRHVSTHSRPKAADPVPYAVVSDLWFQHTAARRRLRRLLGLGRLILVSTHSRPKAAVNIKNDTYTIEYVSTHSRPKAAVTNPSKRKPQWQFQHTAARRRLMPPAQFTGKDPVSTHSRPKAAGYPANRRNGGALVSTHSRPKAAGR